MAYYKIGSVGQPTPPLARAQNRSVILPPKSQTLTAAAQAVPKAAGSIVNSASKPPFATAGKQGNKRSFFTGGKHPVSGEPM